MRRQAAVAMIALSALAACQNANSLALQVGKPPESAVNLRSMQTRKFETTDEKAVLGAATQTLQDLGFTITESSAEVGVITGSKQRDAEESGQIAGQVALTVILALMGSQHNPTWDKEQTIQVTLVATPITNSTKTEVRVTFDRILTNNQGHQWRAELIHEQGIYQEFFERLSKSAFLEAQQV